MIDIDIMSKIIFYSSSLLPSPSSSGSSSSGMPSLSSSSSSPLVRPSPSKSSSISRIPSPSSSSSSVNKKDESNMKTLNSKNSYCDQEFHHCHHHHPQHPSYHLHHCHCPPTSLRTPSCSPTTVPTTTKLFSFSTV